MEVNLTEHELAAAKAAGLSPEHYQALKSVRTHDDFLAAEAAEAARVQALEQKQAA